MDNDYLGLFRDEKLIAVLCLDESGLFEGWYGEINLGVKRIDEKAYSRFVEKHPRGERPRK